MNLGITIPEAVDHVMDERGVIHRDRLDELGYYDLCDVREYLEREIDHISHQLDLEPISMEKRGPVWAAKAKYARSCKQRDLAAVNRRINDVQREEAQRVKEENIRESNARNTEIDLQFKRLAYERLDSDTFMELVQEAEARAQEARS
mgnify:CR=1 FL=1